METRLPVRFTSKVQVWTGRTCQQIEADQKEARAILMGPDYWRNTLQEMVRIGDLLTALHEEWKVAKAVELGERPR